MLKKTILILQSKKLFFITILLITIISGCVSQHENNETQTLHTKPIIDLYPLGGFYEKTDSKLMILKGDKQAVTEQLNNIITKGKTQPTIFSKEDDLNIILFRRVFTSGGYGIRIDKVEKTNNIFTIYSTYSNPEGKMVTQAFTQPTAIIPIGKLPPGNYKLSLKANATTEPEKKEIDFEFKIK